MSNHDLESGQYANGLHKVDSEARNNSLTQTVTLSPEQFERIYLGPKGETAGDLRKRFANPTPIAICGFAVGLLPLSVEFMGWRASGGTFGTATTTCSIWFGGLLLIIGGIGEFLLGNSFPCLVFFGYAAHFLTFATTFMPFYGAVAWNAVEPGNAFEPGPKFSAGFGFYPLALGMLSLVFLLGSLRTNLVFVMIFVCAILGFSFASAGLFYGAAGNMASSEMFVKATGGAFFAADMLGWYLLFAIVIAIMELPVPDLPVFDLSNVIKARSRAKQE
ncbi:hypothetical protein VHEMI05917 [[Torrubiella] hemipterigena]|uniref:GPR1/FUN34/YaaH-class plasma membrane protein n=1 Tax=[Torrubiella] hemipterigena TaxID=1531966 RepID=A0A0A1TI62_9HYPO|nr:hypothetical protein VHEMI05917 [[Torrubiella] hemipterigena]